MAHEELKQKLKEQIIKYLNLMDLDPADIGDDEPLFGPDGDIELDSIDSIELTVLLEREYELKITDPKKGRKILVDVNTMAQYIIDNGKA